MRIATCLWATARRVEGETVRVRREEKSYKACVNVPVSATVSHIRTSSITKPLFLNLCETTVRSILFSKDEGPIPTNLLVNAFSIYF